MVSTLGRCDWRNEAARSGVDDDQRDKENPPARCCRNSSRVLRGDRVPLRRGAVGNLDCRRQVDRAVDLAGAQPAAELAQIARIPAAGSAGEAGPDLERSVGPERRPVLFHVGEPGQRTAGREHLPAAFARRSALGHGQRRPSRVLARCSRPRPRLAWCRDPRGNQGRRHLSHVLLLLQGAVSARQHGACDLPRWSQLAKAGRADLAHRCGGPAGRPTPAWAWRLRRCTNRRRNSGSAGTFSALRYRRDTEEP